MKGSSHKKGQLSVNKLNEHLNDVEDQLYSHVFSEDQQKQLKALRKKEAKASDKKSVDKIKKADLSLESISKADKKRVYVINFEGDVQASAVENLREEITATLMVAKSTDEVVINIESPGGMVHTYGLAASQMARVRQANIPLTVCVDKVAASGGYLMACVANKIVAAPFAIIGSIGVLAQVPNFHRILNRFDIDYDVMTAGEYKAPVTMFGEVTDKGKNKLQSELEETHELFKTFIRNNRSVVDVDAVATGEVWYGQQAIDKALIDEVNTSDDYLVKQKDEADIYRISFEEKKSLADKLGVAASTTVSHIFSQFLTEDRKSHIQRSIH